MQNDRQDSGLRFKFSDAKLKSLPFEAAGTRQSYRDTTVQGLELRVTNQSKKFYVCKWFDPARQIVRTRLGDFPIMNVAKARKEATRVILQLAQGIDVNAIKKARRDEETLGELFDTCKKKDFLPRLKPKTCLEYEATFRRHLSRWRTKPLSLITLNDVERLHIRIGESHGEYGANRTVELLRLLFNHAKRRGFDKPNPAVGIRKFTERARERFLEGDECPRFFKALAEEENETIRDYILMSLLTGARRANVLSMRWRDIRWHDSVWDIPDTKNGTPQRVPLVPEAVKILEQRRSNGGEYVFPSSGKSGHLADPKKAWKRLLQRAEITNLRLHDLRRTLGSWQAATGANLSIIGKSLNHKSVSSTAIYARLELDPVRHSIERATNAFLSAGGVLPSAEVIELEQPRKARAR